MKKVKKVLTPEKIKRNSKINIAGGIIILILSLIGISSDSVFLIFTILGLLFISNGVYCIKKLSAYNESSSLDESGEKTTDCIVNDTNTVTENKSVKILNFKVAGVTFKTGRKSRQVMLKNMYFKNTPPFENGIEITFERYEYEGNIAIGVYSNGLQIGNVPKDIVPKFDEYWTSDYKVSFSIYEGKKSVWGCEISVVFS